MVVLIKRFAALCRAPQPVDQLAVGGRADAEHELGAGAGERDLGP
jgi:hypothetical protein